MTGTAESAAQERFILTSSALIQVSYTASGEAISYEPYVVAGTATLRIEQGSGRFDGATGTIEAVFLETVDADFWGANVKWTLAGTVNY